MICSSLKHCHKLKIIRHSVLIYEAKIFPFILIIQGVLGGVQRLDTKGILLALQRFINTLYSIISPFICYQGTWLITEGLHLNIK